MAEKNIRTVVTSGKVDREGAQRKFLDWWKYSTVWLRYRLYDYICWKWSNYTLQSCAFHCLNILSQQIGLVVKICIWKIKYEKNYKKVFLKPYELSRKQFIFLKINCSWRIITFQYCDGFCHTSTWIGHSYKCVSPILNPLLPLSWPYASGLSQSTSFGYSAS